MKRILYIAKNELYALFYSPIAWIIMIIFLIMTSSTYLYNLDLVVGSWARGGSGRVYSQNLTHLLTVDRFRGYFHDVIRNLYIFFPLITMGLVSRETSSGTIKLLYSSPVHIREIVLGKYLGILCFTMCFVLLILLPITAICLEVVHPDYWHAMVSTAGLFLVLAAYAAIGLFFSSLTSYQVVAAIITLALFTVFSNIRTVWQEVDFVRHITYYLDMGGKAYNSLVGLPNLRDVTYFLILIGSFLSFTVIRLKSATESITWRKKTWRYVRVVAVAAVLGYVTSRPAVNVYHDATRSKLYTITPPTQAMLAKLNDGDLDVTFYTNMFAAFKRPEQENRTNTDLWEPYIRFKPNLKVHYVYYYNADTSSYWIKTNPGKSLKEIATLGAESRHYSVDTWLPPEEVKKQVDIESEENRDFFVLQYKGKKTILRTFDDPMYWPSEDEIGAAINRLIAVPPKIGFVTDEIERAPFSGRMRDYHAIASMLGFRGALINQGFDVDTISLNRGPVPPGLAALVIVDPRKPIAPENLERINRYIDEGGNLFLATEPDRWDVTRPLMEKLGLTLHKGMLIQPNEKYSSNDIFPGLSRAARDFSPQSIRTTEIDEKAYAESVFSVGMEGASAMEYRNKDGFTVTPLLRTDKLYSWNRLAPVDPDSLQLKVSRLPGDETGDFVTAVRMNRMINGKEQRIVVCSDADFPTVPQLIALRQVPRRYNLAFADWCFGWFSYGQFPANTLRPWSLDNAFVIGPDDIDLQKVIFYGILPGVIAIFCSVILIRRKRK